jgi:hypothetical protein
MFVLFLFSPFLILIAFVIFIIYIGFLVYRVFSASKAKKKQAKYDEQGRRITEVSIVEMKDFDSTDDDKEKPKDTEKSED